MFYHIIATSLWPITIRLASAGTIWVGRTTLRWSKNSPSPVKPPSRPLPNYQVPREMLALYWIQFFWGHMGESRSLWQFKAGAFWSHGRSPNHHRFEYEVMVIHDLDDLAVPPPWLWKPPFLHPSSPEFAFGIPFKNVTWINSQSSWLCRKAGRHTLILIFRGAIFDFNLFSLTTYMYKPTLKRIFQGFWPQRPPFQPPAPKAPGTATDRRPCRGGAGGGAADFRGGGIGGARGTAAVEFTKKHTEKSMKIMGFWWCLMVFDGFLVLDN